MEKIIKKMTVELIGYDIGGTASLQLWGGGRGTITITERLLPVKHFSKDNALRCVNDAGYGCEQILGADIWIQEKYDDGGTGKIIWVETSSEYSRKLFGDWAALERLKDNDL